MTMVDLKPTAARLALLRAITDPDVKVYSFREFSTDKPMSVWHLPDHSERVVTVRVAEMETAKLIEKGAASGPSWYARRPWEITEAGRAWLAEHEENR